MIRQLLAWGAIVGLLMASAITWWYLAMIAARRQFLPRQAVRPVPWRLLDLAFFLLLLMLVYLWLGPSPTVQEVGLWRRFLLCESLVRLSWLATILLLLVVLRRAEASDFGLDLSTWRKDLALGAASFALIAPFLYGLQLVLVRWWPKQHPLMDLLQQTDDPVIWMLVAWSVVVVAPISEEIAFRALLQGWLEKCLGRFGDTANDTGDAPSPQRFGLETALDARGQLGTMAGGDSWDQRTGASTTTMAAPSVSPRWLSRCGPILTSSALFAAAHANHGPAWLPLFFLALALGWLYQRTRRLLPSIVLHTLINGYSFLLLMLAGPGAK